MSVRIRYVIIACGALCGLSATAGAQAHDPGVYRLPGLIVDERSLARSVGGGINEAAIPGVRATGGLDAADAARLAELNAARELAAESAPGAAFSEVPPLPGDGDAPARVDSGAPDPDRLHSAPPAPAP